MCRRLKLLVGKQSFLGLLDSGIAVSLIDEQVFKSLNMKLEPTEMKLVTCVVHAAQLMLVFIEYD